MTAVSFDEAWGQAIGPTFETDPIEIEDEQIQIQQPRKTQRSSKYKSARYAENAQSHSIEHKKRKKEENETTTLQELIEKMQVIRQETTEEKIMRQAILYASIILIIILICINLITLNRLHYTTEALLLYVKHKS